jgi:hypothetical protein
VGGGGQGFVFFYVGVESLGPKKKLWILLALPLEIFRRTVSVVGLKSLM